MRNTVRNNFGQFQRYATIALTKHLRAVAEDTGVNVRKVVAKKLEETYKNNVEASYMPSSINGAAVAAHNEEQKNTESENKKPLTYQHTGLFLDSIHVIEDGIYAKVVLDENNAYDKGGGHSVTVRQVYEFLVKGTPATYRPYLFKTGTSKNGKETTSSAVNYGMLPHPFELHTQVQMIAFMKSLEKDILKGKYTKKIKGGRAI